MIRRCGGTSSTQPRYALQVGGGSTLIITNCTFESSLGSSAIWVHGGARAIFDSVVFSNNLAGPVAVVNSTAHFVACSFYQNGVHAMYHDHDTCDEFSLNGRPMDDKMSLFLKSQSQQQDSYCTNHNCAGAIWIHTSNISMNACNLTQNFGSWAGGALATFNSTFVCTGDCNFVANTQLCVENNEVDGLNGGGAIWAQGSTVQMEKSSFRANTAAWGGGAIASFNSDVACVSCSFDSNEQTLPTEYGGAVYICCHSVGRFDQSIFTNNRAAGAGGAVAGWRNSTVECVGCTLTSNKQTKEVSWGGGSCFCDCSIE